MAGKLEGSGAHHPSGNIGKGQVDPERREALAKMGRLAVYTAPAMLTLMVSDKAAAGWSPNPSQHPSQLAQFKQLLQRLFAWLKGPRDPYT